MNTKTKTKVQKKKNPKQNKKKILVITKEIYDDINSKKNEKKVKAKKKAKKKQEIVIELIDNLDDIEVNDDELNMDIDSDNDENLNENGYIKAKQKSPYKSSNGEDLYVIPVDYAEKYRITKSGEIWSCHMSRFMKQRICNGYKNINFVSGANTRTYATHRLLAITFIPNLKNNKYVDHIDAQKQNNNLNNLQWLTQKENVNRSNKKTSHDRIVLQIKDGKIIKEFNSVTEASKSIGKTRRAIQLVLKGRNKTAGGYYWKYKDGSNYCNEDVDVSKGKKIDDYDNYYVFKDGRIYNNYTKRYLKPCNNANGHCYITLCKNKKKKNKYIHRVVAEAFIKNIKNKRFVIHKNRKKDDNRKSNLKWTNCTKI